jgi:antitoxin (DNA-binding transcriptional repressor) of toxin-antitoxin stability system
MTHKPLQELIIEAADRLAKNTSRILEYVNRGERPPEQLTEERDRLVAELIALDEERRNGDSK